MTFSNMLASWRNQIRLEISNESFASLISPQIVAIFVITMRLVLSDTKIQLFSLTLCRPMGCSIKFKNIEVRMVHCIY